MKRLCVLALLCSGALLGSCQCSDKPEVPPVEDAGTHAETNAGAYGARFGG